MKENIFTEGDPLPVVITVRLPRSIENFNELNEVRITINIFTEDMFRKFLLFG